MAYPTVYATAVLPCSWVGQYGGFMNVNFSFNLTCTLYEGTDSDAGKWRLDSVITDWQESHDWGTDVGGGFINVGGIAWASVPLTTIRTPLADGSDDNLEKCIAQRDQVFGSAAKFAAANIWGLYAEDMEKPPAVQGVWDGQMTHSQVITGSPFGQQIAIISPYTRWYDWQNDDPQAAMGAGGGFSVSFSQVFGEYYPGARYESGAWKSSNLPEGDWRFVNGAWVPVKNRIGDNASAKGLRFKTAWVPAQRFD